MAQCLCLKNGPDQITKLIVAGEMVQKQPEKRFYMLFWATLGPFGHHQIDRKKVHKHPQVGGSVWPNFETEKTPLTKSL
jgi:hypothetical protein